MCVLFSFVLIKDNYNIHTDFCLGLNLSSSLQKVSHFLSKVTRLCKVVDFRLDLELEVFFPISKEIMGTPTPTINTSSSMSTATTGRTSLNSGSIKNLVPDWKRKHRIQPPHFVRVGGVISPSKFWVSDIPMLRSQKRKASAGMYPIMGKFISFFHL